MWVEWLVAQSRYEERQNDYVIASALELCYRCEDADSALRIARVMLEGPMRGLIPAKAWVYLLRLAIVLPPLEKQRCIELLNSYDSVLDVWESVSAFKTLEPLEKKAHVSLALCIVQTLRTAPRSPDHDGSERHDDAEFGQHKAWSDLRRRAESFLEKNHK